jgi:hypothetical protein
MESVEYKILASLKKCGRGTVFFPDRFACISSPESVRKAFTSLVEKEEIIRVARGIYCYPKIDKVLGLGALMPSVDDIVNAIAKRDHMKVAPTGVHAQNLLGLSTQVPMNFVYLTNGWSRKLTVLNGISVKLKQTALKNLSFNSRLAMLITFALKDIGQGNVTDEQIVRIHKLLANETKESIIQDLALMPVWIRQIILKTYEQN